jgi:hypothetical protein
MTTGEGDGEKVPYWRETMGKAGQSQSISRRTAGTLRAAPGMGRRTRLGQPAIDQSVRATRMPCFTAKRTGRMMW